MSSPERSREHTAELLLIVVVVIWAANYPIAKWAIAGLNVFVFNGIRYIVAAAGVLLFFRLRHAWTPITRKDWPALLRAGFIANVLYQMAFIVGLSLTTAGNSAVLLSTSPTLDALLQRTASQREDPSGDGDRYGCLSLRRHHDHHREREEAGVRQHGVGG